MASFSNQAQLTYNGVSLLSNRVTGELLERLSVTKVAVVDSYTAGGSVAFVITLVNPGSVALTGVTVTDTLGSYPFGEGDLVPLTYVDGSVKYFLNGALQLPPSVDNGPPLVFQNISVPANGNTTIAYQTIINEYAPLGVDGEITNEVTVQTDNSCFPVTVQETISTVDGASLSMIKAICPGAVCRDGQLTYTITIQNTGNQPIEASDGVIITDSFNPPLSDITITFNDVLWINGTNYTYTAQGLFTSIAGSVTVPAATYTQDATTGQWIVSPGTSILVITGTV